MRTIGNWESHRDDRTETKTEPEEVKLFLLNHLHKISLTYTGENSEERCSLFSNHPINHDPTGSRAL